jgi:TetR/AcrR family transcriptional repressor of nem operon
MRYSPEHKQETRERVLAEAGKAIRKEGPYRVSVGAVMKRAGLTHGGFYAHFKSKDAMLVAAIEQMFEAGRDRWIKVTFDKGPADGLAAYVEWYLSPAHRDAREAGCTVAALASDLPRLSPACQKAYAEGTRRMTAWLASMIDKLGRPRAEELAVSTLAELVGALSLARAETEPKRSAEIMATSRASVRRKLEL